jgi:hypothetical protein
MIGDIEFWKLALGIAGIGAVAAFVIWSLYKKWLSLPIFQRMEKRQQFIIFILFFTLTFLFAIGGLAAYVVTHLYDAKNSGFQVKNESQLDELLQHVEWKASLIHRNFEKAIEEGADASKMHAFESQFNSLHNEHLSALRQGQYTRGYEIRSEVWQLLRDASQAGFKVPQTTFYTFSGTEEQYREMVIQDAYPGSIRGQEVVQPHR